jgi:hypothetical protein
MVTTRLSLAGHYEQGAVEFNPIVTVVGGDTATVQDCDFDHSVEVDAAGTPVERPNVGHSLLLFSMARLNGNWYVADSKIVQSGKTGDDCAPG